MKCTGVRFLAGIVPLMLIEVEMAEELTREQTATKVSKIIKMNNADAVVNQVYFNPIFTNDLVRKTPELTGHGFILAQTETESEEGTVVAGKVQAPDGTILDLGSVLLDGKTVRINRDLTAVSDLVKFIGAGPTVAPVPDKD